MSMRCIAVDDEPLALELICDNISRTEGLELVTSCGSAEEALEFLRDHPVDLLFLDIQMPGMNGIQLLKNLVKPPLVIMTTAYEHYAVEGFELDVVDYLLKPIPLDRFQKAVARAAEYHRLTKADIPAKQTGVLLVKSSYKTHRILHDDILFIEGMKDYVKIFIRNQLQPLITRLNVKTIELQLPQGKFIRVHRSFIVAIDKVNTLQSTRIGIGNTTIPVGIRYRQSLKDRLQKKSSGSEE